MALTSQTAFRADDFIESIGVGTHLGATTSAYGNLTLVEQSLVYLGVDHVRDTTPGPSPQEVSVGRFLSVGSFTLNGKTYKTIFDLIGGTSLSVTMTYLDKLAPYVGFVEGPNEVNYAPIHFTTATGTVLYGRAAADAYQEALYADVNSDPLLTNTSVLTFSLGPGTSFAGYGNLSAYADYTNVHAYGTLGVPPIFYLTVEVNAVTLAPSRPYVITETGNFTMPTTPNGVTDDVQAKLEEYTLLDAFKLGVKQTYLYQLLDAFNDPNNTNDEDHYGLFNFNGTPKTSAITIHDLTTILGDAATNSQSFTTQPLTYSVDNLPLTGKQMLFEKSDGTYDIALWQEQVIWNYTNLVEYVIAPTTVTVTLGGVYQTIKVYDPLVSSTPIAIYHNVSSIQVALGSSALIVEVDPNVSVGPTGQYIATGTAGGVFASTGADTVVAGSGAATVNVSGAATITGSTGTLAVNFTGSQASLTGDGGALTVTSKSGSNTVTGGSGAFSYTDLAGNDVVTTGSSANNTVVLGSGSDTVTVLGIASVTGGSGAANIILTGSGASVTGGSGALTVTDKGGSNTVTGGTGAFNYTDTAGNDLVTTGTSSSNNLTLGGGSDTVSVLAATILNSGISNATVTLFASGSLITGGSGTLTVTDVGTGSNTIVGGSGALTVIDGNGGDSITGGVGAIAVSAVVGGDAITTNNTSGLSVITLGAGSDTVLANGATYIQANTANVVVSGAGPLSINGGTGSMTVDGGASSDNVFTQSGTQNLISLGSGPDTVLSHGADTINASTLSGAGSERIYAGGAASITGGSGLLLVNGQGDNMTVKGGTGALNALAAGDNSYFKGGSNGGNVLSASGGNTTLVGGGAGDRLSDIGSAGGNLLTAGPGGATLMAGSGNDTLAGGGGGDVFVLTAAAAAHTTVIQGYLSGTDTLSFNGFDSNPIASQQVVSGSLQLTLDDHSTVTLIGVTSLS